MVIRKENQPIFFAFFLFFYISFKYAENYDNSKRIYLYLCYLGFNFKSINIFEKIFLIKYKFIIFFI